MAPSCVPAKKFVGKAWPEADALFHKEPRWLGADGAYSIELAPGRTLWLFGDTFVATSAALVRTESKFVRNSVAIQTGSDPTKSVISFYWRENGAPSSFFPEAGEHWFWPVHGARVGRELVLFLNELEKTTEGFGFRGVGTTMVRIDNPDEPPLSWHLHTRALPVDGRSHGTAVVVEQGSLFSLTTKPSAFFNDVELERWSTDDLDAPSERESLLWKAGAPEFTTARHCGEYLTIESRGFGGTNLAVRRARALSGPWSEPVDIYHPPESDKPNPFVYAGKFHPELTGADLVATYANNRFDFNEVLRDRSVYYPRFVKIRETH